MSEFRPPGRTATPAKRRTEPSVYLAVPQTLYLRYLLAMAQWTPEECQNPPGLHYTDEAYDEWEIDDEAQRGIGPAAWNARIAYYFGYDRGEWLNWCSDDLLRLKILGKNPFELWLLHAGLGVLGASWQELKPFRYPLPPDVENCITVPGDLYRRYPDDPLVHQLIADIGRIYQGTLALLLADDHRAAVDAEFALMPPTRRRSRQVLRQLLDEHLSEFVARMYPESLLAESADPAVFTTDRPIGTSAGPERRPTS